MELKTVLIVSITTLRMIFPGLPTTTNTPNGAERQALPATRQFAIGLLSDKPAGRDASAEMTVPDGLKLGPKISLEIDRTPAAAATAKTDTGTKAEQQKFVSKTYWGCGESVPEGQPRVNDTQNPAAAKDALPALSFPQGSDAYWPPENTDPIKHDAATTGDYALTTNYCGGTSFSLSPQQSFLGAIELIGVKDKFDLEKPVKIVWKAVLNAKAYLLVAYGGNRSESISWTSGADPDLAPALENRPLSAEELAKYIENKALLPSTSASCIIPAGVFKTAKSAMVSVIAFGKDLLQEKDGIETRVVPRSKVTLPIIGHPLPPEREQPPAPP